MYKYDPADGSLEHFTARPACVRARPMEAGLNAGDSKALAVVGHSSWSLCALVRHAFAVGVLVRAFELPSGHFLATGPQFQYLKFRRRFRAAISGDGHQQGTH